MRIFLFILITLTSCTKDDKEIFYYNCDCRPITIKYNNGDSIINYGIVYKKNIPLVYKINQKYGLIMDSRIFDKVNYITDTFMSDRSYYYLYGSFDTSFTRISYNYKSWIVSTFVSYDSCDCRR